MFISQFVKLRGLYSGRRVREIESGKTKEVGSAKIERICKRFPEYALWLITGQMQSPSQICQKLIKNGQIVDCMSETLELIKKDLK